MKHHATLLEILTYGSVRLGEVLIPPGRIERALAPYTERLVCFHDRDPLSTQCLGSCTLLYNSKSYYAVCTGHQLKGINPNDIYLATETEHLFISTGSITTVNKSKVSLEVEDVCVLDFTSAVTSNRISRHNFYDLSKPNRIYDGSHVVALCCRGYAFKDSDLDYELNEEGFPLVTKLHGKNRSFICDTSEPTSDPTMTRLTREAEFGQSVDGFSGGAVFAVCEDSNMDFSIKYYGLITRGGGKHFHCVNAADVYRCLNWTSYN